MILGYNQWLIIRIHRSLSVWNWVGNNWNTWSVQIHTSIFIHFCMLIGSLYNLKQPQKKTLDCKIWTYQAEPCGSQGPKQTQQNSALQFWFRHTMWLQPPSFSIVTWHFGHSCDTTGRKSFFRVTRRHREEFTTSQQAYQLTFVFAAIQFDVSLSSSHFLIHFLNHWEREVK